MQLKPLGDGFIKLIRLLIAPIIFCTVVTSIAGLALLYFEVVTTLALLIGLLIVNMVKPGAGVNADPATLDAQAIAQYAIPGSMPGVADFILNIIPAIIFGAFASGDVLQTLLLALARLMGCFYLTCVLFVLGVLGIITRLHGFSILAFIRYIREELFIVLGTSLSESVLPRMPGKLEDLGVRKSIVGLVIPAGYSFNLDGGSIYLTMATVYIAQATNTPLDLWHQVTLLAVMLVTSKGMAGVSGSGFIALAASLSAWGHVPVAAWR